MFWTRLMRLTGLMEWVCTHGVGHPDHVSAAMVAEKTDHNVDVWLSHGCDGCCGRDDFPGRYSNGKDSSRSKTEG